MKEDVRNERSHEQERGRAWIGDADRARFARAPEVARHDREAAARRAVFAARIERNDQRGIAALVHGEDEVLHDGRSGERHPLFGDAPEDDARIRRGIDVLELENAVRQLDAAAHGRFEQRLFRIEMTKDGGRSDAELACDIGERRRREALLREHAPGGVEDLLAADGRRPAHL